MTPFLYINITWTRPHSTFLCPQPSLSSEVPDQGFPPLRGGGCPPRRQEGSAMGGELSDQELLVQPYHPPLCHPAKIWQKPFGQDDRLRWVVPLVSPPGRSVGKTLHRRGSSTSSGWTGSRSIRSLFGSNTSFGKTLQKKKMIISNNISIPVSRSAEIQLIDSGLKICHLTVS